LNKQSRDHAWPRGARGQRRRGGRRLPIWRPPQQSAVLSSAPLGPV